MRLTHYDEHKKRWQINNDYGAVMIDELNYAVGEAVDKLAAYEDAEEQGRLVILPCKVGTTVYIVTCCGCVYMYQDRDYFTGTGEVICPYEDDCDFENCDGKNVRVFEDTFTGYSIDESGIHYCFDHVNGWLFEEDCFGKTVFLTRAEAEAALKGEREDV